MEANEKIIHVKESPIRATYYYVKARALGEIVYNLILINLQGNRFTLLESVLTTY